MVENHTYSLTYVGKYSNLYLDSQQFQDNMLWPKDFHYTCQSLKKIRRWIRALLKLCVAANRELYVACFLCLHTVFFRWNSKFKTIKSKGISNHVNKYYLKGQILSYLSVKYTYVHIWNSALDFFCCSSYNPFNLIGIFFHL